MPVDTNISFDRVILSDENRLKYQQFIAENEKREQLMRYNLKPMNRLLLYGASGTGKTFSLKALSNKMNYEMLYLDIAAGLSSGNVADNMSLVFEYANEKGNCLIFFDECDAIAWSRDSNNNPESGDIRRCCNSLFQLLDQMSPDNIFASATNMIYRLDPAFARRFDLKMEFTRPKTSLDNDIAHFIYPEFTLVDDTDSNWKNIIQKRHTMSYYEIEGTVYRAMKRAVMEGHTIVRTSWIYDMFAVSLKIQKKFKTDIDEPEVFKQPKDTFSN